MWQEKDNSLYREFLFKDFKQAFSFIESVAVEAERLEHHPRWENDYNIVKIWLSTHEEHDSITDRDQVLATAIDAVYDKQTGKGAGSKVTTKSTDIKLYTDGGSRGNPGPAASGFVILDQADKVLVEKGIYLGITTNNQAEYKALKFALEEAKALGAKKVDVYMDSLLIVNQMLGKFKIKNGDLLPINHSVKELVKLFDQVTFTHVPRELNKKADAMVNKALDEALGL
ncbi:MAG TPA: reverse transcriptase-like protein [Candidatus Binatia bacterium]|nr:reverse transcriptase-like protein [Candidatus Binatia bacterium]